MSPLNRLMNYSAELTQTPSFFSKNISSRFLMGFCVPLELITILEKTIKLPVQIIALTVKIPAKSLNVIINSPSLKEFESKLAGPLNIIETALKIVGYAVGCFFTLSLGILSPYKNFQVHFKLGLIHNHQAEKQQREAEENKQNQITLHEKIFENRLKSIIEAKQKSQLLSQNSVQEESKELEILNPEPSLIIQEAFKGSSPISLQVEEQKEELNEKQNEETIIEDFPKIYPDTTEIFEERIFAPDLSSFA